MNRKEIKKGKSVVIVETTDLQIGGVDGIFVKISSLDDSICIWGHRKEQLKQSIAEIVRDYFPWQSITWKRVYNFTNDILNDYNWE